jgi:hypothetical protein
MAIVARFALDDLESKDEPLRHHRLGLQYTRSGYGSRIPTATMVKLPGSPRWRRVYHCVWSNIGTSYVPDKQGNWIVIS